MCLSKAHHARLLHELSELLNVHLAPCAASVKSSNLNQGTFPSLFRSIAAKIFLVLRAYRLYTAALEELLVKEGRGDRIVLHLA